MDFNIKYKSGYFLCTTSGVAKTDIFTELLDDMLNHEHWKPSMHWIHDHTHLDVSNLTSGNIINFAKMCVKRRYQIGHGKCGIVATEANVFGLARMWQTYVTDSWDADVRVHHSLDETIAWL